MLQFLMENLAIKLKNKNFELMTVILDQKVIFMRKDFFQKVMELQNFRKKINLVIFLNIIS